MLQFKYLQILNTYRTIHDGQIATIGRSRYGDASHSSKQHQRRRWVLSIKIIVTMGALRKSNAQAVRSRSWCSDCFRWYLQQIRCKGYRSTDLPVWQHWLSPQLCLPVLNAERNYVFGQANCVFQSYRSVVTDSSDCANTCFAWFATLIVTT